jgi:alpha-galactosidase
MFLAAAVAVAGAGLTTFGASPTEAAVLSTGVPISDGKKADGGGDICADVAAFKNADGVSVQAWVCNAAPNQQFELSGQTIFALGGQRCLDVVGGKTADRTPVVSFTCTGSPSQKWYYENGQIVHTISGKCLDAGANLKIGTQLVIYPCLAGITSQQWQIK